MAFVREIASAEYALVKLEGVRRRVAVRRLGRIASLREVSIVEIAEGVSGGVIRRRESLVVCARKVAAQVERSGRGRDCLAADRCYVEGSH